MCGHGAQVRFCFVPFDVQNRVSLYEPVCFEAVSLSREIYALDGANEGFRPSFDIFKGVRGVGAPHTHTETY